MNILILGIGNTILSDEGVGVHVLDALSKDQFPGGTMPDSVTLLDGGTLSFTLAGPIQDHAALIVVDATNLQLPAGSVRVFEGEQMDAFLMHNRKSSVHEVGLTDLRAIAMLGGHWPERRALVGRQPQPLDRGESPTPEVAAAMPVACAEIMNILKNWETLPQ